MMSFRVFSRFLHVQTRCLAAEKSLLATLRKKTGYTFSNCKKALEMHNNDLKQAEDWLKEQAKTLGWAKATKLEGRQTSQGLIGLAVQNRDAALVEVNCETDFVARNKEFQKMVEEATLSCLNFTQKQPETSIVSKVSLDGDKLKSLPAHDGKPLSEHLVLMIGSVGENASLKRACCVKAQDNVHLSGYVHPSGADGTVLLGKIGALVALKELVPKGVNLELLGKELCQHIVGMNPKKVGSPSDKPAKDKEEETCLIHQEYLLDESTTVKEILDENEVEVISFKRFECGESTTQAVEQSLDLVETCQ